MVALHFEEEVHACEYLIVDHMLHQLVLLDYGVHEVFDNFPYPVLELEPVEAVLDVHELHLIFQLGDAWLRFRRVLNLIQTGRIDPTFDRYLVFLPVILLSWVNIALGESVRLQSLLNVHFEVLEGDVDLGVILGSAFGLVGHEFGWE